MADFDSLRYYTPGKCKALTNKLGQSLDSLYSLKRGKLLASMLTPKRNTKSPPNNYSKLNFELSHPFSDPPARLKLLKTFYSFHLRNSCCVFSHLHTVNLSNNSLSIVPDEFCNLSTLKECYLSFNNIKYLPDNLRNLQSLLILHLNSNKLVYLPSSVRDMEQLQELDLYDNILVEFPWFLNRLLLLDMYENFVEELFDESYIAQAERFRTKYGYKRSVKSKQYVSRSYSGTEEEDITNPTLYIYNYDEEEDWDGDEFWDPSCRDPFPAHVLEVLDHHVEMVRKKGGFVPSDLHVASSSSRVRPITPILVPGQFDDDDD